MIIDDLLNELFDSLLFFPEFGLTWGESQRFTFFFFWTTIRTMHKAVFAGSQRVRSELGRVAYPMPLLTRTSRRVLNFSYDAESDSRFIAAASPGDSMRREGSEVIVISDAPQINSESL